MTDTPPYGLMLSETSSPVEARLLRVGGWSSLCVWVMVLPFAVLMVFSYLGALGGLYVAICLTAIVASIKAIRGRWRAAQVLVTTSALMLLWGYMSLTSNDFEPTEKRAPQVVVQLFSTAASATTLTASAAVLLRRRRGC